jgi:hypothetical protein
LLLVKGLHLVTPNAKWADPLNWTVGLRNA